MHLRRRLPAARVARGFVVRFCISAALGISFFSVFVLGLMGVYWSSPTPAFTERAVTLPSGGLRRGPAHMTPSPTAPTPIQGEAVKRTHVFYYPWYGSPKGSEKEWLHWNHVVLPHWEKSTNVQYPDIGKVFSPPEEIGANFYPSAGPYSSSSKSTIDRHMKEISGAGIGVIVMSWYPPGFTDDNGRPSLFDPLVPAILEAADQHFLKVCFHLEPYQGRTSQSVQSDVDYLVDTYASHPAALKVDDKIVVYVYDSYNVQDWHLQNKRAVYLGLVVEQRHLQELHRNNFDGVYTYFGAEGFVWGSTKAHWPLIAEFCRNAGMLISLSAAPGYDDTRIRPWNHKNKRSRRNGETYRESFRAAAHLRPDFISITSFNEWHEGTQIEPSTSRFPGYETFENLPEDGYLKLTLELVEEWGKAYQVS